MSEDITRGFKEAIERFKLSFVQIQKDYEDIQSDKIPSRYRDLVKDSSLSEGDRKTCLLSALHQIFDDKPYDKVLEAEITAYTKEYRYYPDPKEINFLKVIQDKQEFGMTQVEETRRTFGDACQNATFELAPHQIFLKQWMSPNTPYKSLLIFHGVGVGKTCSGISIAENFKDLYGSKGQRILILASQKIQVGWKNTLVNPALGEAQCTGDTYQVYGTQSETKLQSFRKKIVKTYYDMMGYTAFANSVTRLLAKESHQGSEEECIRRHFSDRMLIIDEVHNIRATDTQETRDTIQMIMKVIQHSRNLRLVLLTANPMFNQPNEIIWILNMLLLNDGRPIVTEREIFHKGPERTVDSGVLSQAGHEILAQKSKGYVSYVRGENPVSFPLRLYPQEKTKHHLKPTETYTDVFGTPTSLTFLQLYSSYLTGPQREVYEALLPQGQSAFQIQEETQLLQVGNIVYPGAGDVPLQERYGEAGFDACFKETKGPVYAYTRGTTPFLDLETIGDYSQKLKSILESLSRTHGIVFIYTNWIKGGLVPLLLALEQNGYRKYGGQEIWRSQDTREPLSYEGKVRSSYEDPTSFRQASYMVVSAIDGLSARYEEELKVLTSEDNKEGQQIKIVIGSTVASEGLDFKNIRAIHILEPWHNLNKLEQVVGRGVRNCSHKALPAEERNVTIYLHNAMISPKHGTLDTHLYQYSEGKAQEIGTIETLLKQHAIDRHLFREANLKLQKQDVDPIHVTYAYRGSPKTTIYPTDQAYSRVCSFQPTCDYLRDDPAPPIPDELTRDTLELRYSQGLIRTYQKRVSQLFRRCMVYSYEEILLNLREHQKVYECVLQEALEQMVNHHVRVRNPLGDSGRLIECRVKERITYLFQPDFSNDPTIPYYYRIHRGTYRYPDTTIQARKTRSQEVSWEPMLCDRESCPLTTWFEPKGEVAHILRSWKFPGAVGTEYLFDRLAYTQKLSVLCHVVAHLKGDEEYTEAEVSLLTTIRTYMAPAFLYHEEDTDVFSWKPTFQTEDTDSLYGFQVVLGPKHEIYAYQYRGAEIQRINRVDAEAIRRVQTGPKPSLDRTGTWGYLVYSRRHRLQNNGWVCKMIDRTGPGTIVVDSHKNNPNQISQDLLGYLQTTYPTIWDRGSVADRMQTEIQMSQKSKIRPFLATLLELCCREHTQMIPPESAFLKFDLK